MIPYEAEVVVQYFERAVGTFVRQVAQVIAWAADFLIFDLPDYPFYQNLELDFLELFRYPSLVQQHCSNE